MYSPVPPWNVNFHIYRFDKTHWTSLAIVYSTLFTPSLNKSNKQAKNREEVTLAQDSWLVLKQNKTLKKKSFDQNDTKNIQLYLCCIFWNHLSTAQKNSWEQDLSWVQNTNQDQSMNHLTEIKFLRDQIFANFIFAWISFLGIHGFLNDREDLSPGSVCYFTFSEN